MREVLLVGAGGFAGSILRALLVTAVVRARVAESFPLATLVVNVLGCLAFGLVVGFAGARGALPSATRAFVVVGLLGGFTTFSAFGGETFELLRTGHVAAALGSIALQVGLGVGAVGAGYAATNR
jgi:CrcB protein